jgi:hypothetical protein
MVGLTPQETLHSYFVTSQQCGFVVTLFDSQGKSLQTFQGNTNPPNVTGVSEINGNDFTVDLTARTEVRVVASFFALPGAGGSTCPVDGSLEISNRLTGITTFVVHELGHTLGLNHFGVGTTPLEVVRFNLVAYPPSPCVGALSFFDANGNPIGPSKTVSLAPGTADFLDLNIATTGSAVGLFQRVVVQPVFTPTPGTDPSGCVGSVEVYDVFSNQTRAFYPGEPPN